MTLRAQLVDLHQSKIYPVALKIEGKHIASLEAEAHQAPLYLMPGFIDAHVHIESSMLVPTAFARLATIHGTVATVSDPHEIANVLGMQGVQYMIANGKQSPLKFYFGAPSCVPATQFETAGATIDAQGIDKLLQMEEIHYLAEMMNYPGVLFKDEEVLAKIALAKKYDKPVDGHAPGLSGEQAVQYIQAGISTDHESVSEAEARWKLENGMKILIREGSAAKNFEALIGLMREYPQQLMFCSDDKHPDDLLLGHINQLVARAVAKGHDLFDVLRAACLNPIEHYQLDLGQLRVGDLADFILVKDLIHFEVAQTYIEGKLVADQGKSLIEPTTPSIVNHFEVAPKTQELFEIPALSPRVKAIQVIDGELITQSQVVDATIRDQQIVADPHKDLAKIAVVNRYQEADPAVALIQNVGLTQGAFASSVAHDSHNLIAVGMDDASLCRAVNLLIASKGGISVVGPEGEAVLPLPIAGLMSDLEGEAVAQAYTELDQQVKALGSTLRAPFMSLSFMALLVIPNLKLSDKGLFDGGRFTFTSMYV